MRALLLAEKPSLMRNIERVYRDHREQIGVDITFMAQAGHLLGLKMPDEINPVYKKWSLENLPLDVNFRYKVLKGKQELVRDIKAAIQSGNYDMIIHAGDPDQEGEILIRETLDYAHNTLPVRRFWTNDQTEEAILAALHQLQDDRSFDNLAAAGFARQHADYVYGMNLTECMSIKSGTTVRIGRVKAPIIKAIVDREKEIENFVPSSIYERAFSYERNGNSCLFVDESEVFETEEELQRSMRAIPSSAEVTNCRQAEKVIKAPKLYKLSTLQTDAYNKLHFSAAMTLNTLQALYEKQLVSYPRTSCEYISSREDVLGIYGRLQGQVPAIREHGLTPRSERSIKTDRAYCNDQAIASEGHTGIIPTGQLPRNLTDVEGKLYELIVRRFLAICLPPKRVQNTVITAKDCNGFSYVCKGVTDLEPSFEYVLNPGYAPKQFDFAPPAGTELSPVTFLPKEIQKKCPVRYNDGSLIKFLSNPRDYTDEEGKSVKYTIGTEATRASIIEECVKSNYFTKEKSVFAPTDFARTIVQDYGDLEVFQVDNSAEWECDLDRIRQGEVPAEEVERNLTDTLVDMVNDLKGRTVTKLAFHANKAGYPPAGKAEGLCPCPACKDGIIRENTKAFGCSNWNASPKCGFTIWKSAFGATLTASDAKKLIAGKTIVKTCHSKAGKAYKKELALDRNEGRVVWAEEINRGNEARER